MEQFYDPPQNNSRKNIAQLFQNLTENAAAKSNNDNFVPFTQERDKLGRLISRQNKLRENKNHQSLPSNITIKSHKNLERNQSQKPKLSNGALERMFKLNEVKQFKSAKHLDKIRILSTSSRGKMQAPLIGQYDIAAIADKIKYKKPTLIALKNTKLSAKPLPIQPTSQRDIKVPRKALVKKEQRGAGSKGEALKLQVNYDLPELQKYHEMKKLKMKHYDNFQQNHLKFKQLARFSLVLANQIKKGLELD